MILLTDTNSPRADLLGKYELIVYIGNDDYADRNVLCQYTTEGGLGQVTKFTDSLFPWENLQMWHQENGFADFQLYSETPDQYMWYVRPERHLIAPSQKYWNPPQILGVDEQGNILIG